MPSGDEDATTDATTAAPLMAEGGNFGASSPPPLGLDASNVVATTGPWDLGTTLLDATSSSL